MKAKRMSQPPGPAVWALVFESGDEVIGGLTAFALLRRFDPAVGIALIDLDAAEAVPAGTAAGKASAAGAALE